jgi:hypothetical protein
MEKILSTQRRKFAVPANITADLCTFLRQIEIEIEIKRGDEAFHPVRQTLSERNKVPRKK